MFQEAEWAEWRKPNPVGAGLLEEVGFREPGDPDWDDGAEIAEGDLVETGLATDRKPANQPGAPEREAWGPRADAKRRGEDEEEEFEEDDELEEDEEFEEDEDLDEEFDDDEFDDDEEVDDEVEEEGEEEEL